MREEEAKSKACPMFNRQVASIEQRRCVGSDCAWWVWQNHQGSIGECVMIDYSRQIYRLLDRR